MATMSHDPSATMGETRSWRPQLLVPEMWGSLAIVVMWLAVLFDAVFGPNIEIDSMQGDRVVIPTAGGLALFAFLGTWVVARCAFRRGRKE